MPVNKRMIGAVIEFKKEVSAVLNKKLPSVSTSSDVELDELVYVS